MTTKTETQPELKLQEKENEQTPAPIEMQKAPAPLSKEQVDKLKPWQKSLVTAEGRMLSITDSERVKVELGFASQIIGNNDVLQKCDPASILNAVINISRTSITINPALKLAYLVPRGGACVLDISYVGLIKMLKDNKCVSYVDAFVVFKDEVDAGQFNYDMVSGTITHTPIYAESEAAQKLRKVYGAYSRAILPDKSVVYCFMPYWEVEKVKNTSKAAGTAYSPWNTWTEEMIKKTVIKRHFKLLIAGSPSAELANVLELEENNNGLADKYKANKNRSIADSFLND